MSGAVLECITEGLVASSEYPYTIEFFTERGRQPVWDWLMRLTPAKRRTAEAGLTELLQAMGKDVCDTEFGRNLGGGLYELRLRQPRDQLIRRLGRIGPAERHPEDEGVDILLRIFFHAHGERMVLLLGAYDKGERDAPAFQARQIALARKRLAQWKRLQPRRSR